jgi:hypothetical protein
MSDEDNVALEMKPSLTPMGSNFLFLVMKLEVMHLLHMPI